MRQGLRWGDLAWIAVLAAVAAFLLVPETNRLFVASTAAHPYLVGFAKFLVLATMGELLARRIVGGSWSAPAGLPLRALVWGFLGVAIVLVFEVFGSGVVSAQGKGLLPFAGSRLGFAFLVSAVMNIVFAPTMMLFHRLTDTWIDLSSERRSPRPSMTEVAARIDWKGFISFVLFRTIPVFWTPAHTITFLLPGEYRVLMAAFLSIALGAILAFAKKKSGPATAGATAREQQP